MSKSDALGPELVVGDETVLLLLEELLDLCSWVEHLHRHIWRCKRRRCGRWRTRCAAIERRALVRSSSVTPLAFFLDVWGIIESFNVSERARSTAPTLPRFAVIRRETRRAVEHTAA